MKADDRLGYGKGIEECDCRMWKQRSNVEAAVNEKVMIDWRRRS